MTADNDNLQRRVTVQVASMMRYHVLASDYDGTLAHHGRVRGGQLGAAGRELDVGGNGVVTGLLGHPRSPEQRSQHGDRLIEPLPALLESHAN